MIVELKRPQKTGYDAGKDESTHNPVDQLINQIDDLGQRGKITTTSNRDIEISEDSMARGYVLADWNNSLERYLIRQDFAVTDFGGKMAYKYYREINTIVEVIAFDRLVDRASKRNEAFVAMLQGRSNFDRKNIHPSLTPVNKKHA